jgi:hypothetical protein
MRFTDDTVERFVAGLPDARRRYELTSGFLESLPSDRDELRRVVGEGVWKTIAISYESPLKSQYGQLSVGKAGRLCRLWLTDPEAFERTRPAWVVEAVHQFAADDALDQARRQLAWQEALDEQLPSPPPGYKWESDNRRLREPGVFTFRLWSRDMGRMPTSG